MFLIKLVYMFYCLLWYRYKIYAEGRSWSVSEKYILACDSLSLIITPHYYDFFSRSLLPGIHYWPISEADKCKSIDSVVEMGNNYTEKVIYLVENVELLEHVMYYIMSWALTNDSLCAFV